ncbi:MAG: ribosomal protein L7/L12 [Prevotella sp.]|nr:ribosomal protein L7/L12 [Prevotella sp.]
MPSKKIQLRGISRLPSDRMTTDGGLSVSLNTQLENDENASMILPDDLTRRMGAGEHHIPEFLHRMTSVKNVLMLDYNRKNLYYVADKGRVTYDVSLISVGGNKTNVIKAIMDVTGKGLREVKNIVDNAPVQDAFSFDTREEAVALMNAINEAGGQAELNDKAVAGGGDTLIYNFGSEKVLDIQAMGNTIAVRTDDHMHYIKWKDGEYQYLGTKIPEAFVKVITTDERPEQDQISLSSLKAKSNPMEAFWIAIGNQTSSSRIAEYINDELKELNDSQKTVVAETKDMIWAKIQDMVAAQRKDGRFFFPVFLRHSIILFDGSNYHQSSPQLLGDGDINQHIKVTVSSAGISVTLLNTHKESYQVKMSGGTDWNEIIRSVRIGLSTDICNPLMSSKIERAEEIGGEVVLIFKDQSGYASASDIEKEMLSKTLFYSVDERVPEEIHSSYGNTYDIKPLGQDELVLKDEIPDDELSHHEIVPLGEVMNYNARFVYPGVKHIVYEGHPFPLSVAVIPSNLPRTMVYDSFTIDYYLNNGDGGIIKVTALNDEGGTVFNGMLGGWLYYPDPRCFKAVITTYGSMIAQKTYSIAMKEHPGLNGSYSIADLSAGMIINHYSQRDADATLLSEDVDLRTIYEKGKVYMTKAFNPFVYPTETRYSFQNDIIKVVPTTLALSQNQFMAHELYVFTSGGIWTMKLAENGNSYQILSLSRDIAATPDLIIPIEQAVVFATDSAVNIIREGQVASISPYMNGEHYTLSGERDLGTPSCAEILSGIDEYGEDAAEILTDDTPFMEFMENARCTYDSNGRRLLFFNESKLYQYVFCLDSATWHTMTLELSDLSGLRFVRTLNSYPDALVSMRSGTEGRLIDASTHYGRNIKETETMPSVIITRPFNLEEVDILKSITDVRIRGKYNAFQKRVSFMLQGSQDGISFHRLSSLRGKSWKVFRMVILARLKPEERISYVEVEYQPRFGNRMR